jgi:hypothetical protein
MRSNLTITNVKNVNKRKKSWQYLSVNIPMHVLQKEEHTTNLLLKNRSNANLAVVSNYPTKFALAAERIN